MKKKLFILSFLLLYVVNAFALLEVRYLFGGCSGNWILVCYDCADSPIISGYGTYDFCRVSQETDVTIHKVEAQSATDMFRTLQPYVADRDYVTREDVKSIEKKQTSITLMGNPIRDSVLKGKINDEIESSLVFEYEIIGFDGQKYHAGKTQTEGLDFNIELEKKLPTGTYFIIMGTGDIDKVYSSNFIVGH